MTIWTIIAIVVIILNALVVLFEDSKISRFLSLMAVFAWIVVLIIELSKD